MTNAPGSTSAIGSIKRQSVRGGAATMIAQGVKFLIRLAAQIAIARFLIPADYGIIAMVAPVLALVQLVADLGLGEATLQQTRLDNEDISTLFWLGFAMNLGMAVVVCGLAPIISASYGEPRLVGVAIALACLIPIGGLATQPRALLNRDLRLGRLAWLDVIPPGVSLAAGFVAAVTGAGYWSLVISTYAETIAYIGLVILLHPWRPGLRCNIAAARQSLRVGRNITLFNLAQYATTTADNILLGALQGPAALGLYDKAYKTVTLPLGQLMIPANRIALPALVRLLPHPGRYRQAYTNMLEIMVVAGTPGVVFLMFRASPLIHTLLGPAWDGIGPVMSWLSLGCLASPIYASTMWLFVSQGRSGQQFRVAVATSLISVASFAIGLPWGPAGVACAAGASFLLISTPLTCWAATRAGPVDGRALIRCLAPIAVALVVTAALWVPVAIHFAHPGPVALTIEFGASYAGFCSVLACTGSGRRLIRDVWELSQTLRGTHGRTLQVPAV